MEKQDNNNASKKLIYVLLAAIFAVLLLVGSLGGYIAGYNSGEEHANKIDLIESDLEQLVEIYTILEDDYYTEVDRENFLDGAIAGAVASLEDPYTAFFNKEETEDYLNSLENEYVGIGVLLSETPNGVKIEKVFSDSPAEKAGIVKDDVLFAIDGVNVLESSLDEIRELTLGEEDTPVVVTVLRGEKELDFTVIRGVVAIDTIIARSIQGDQGDYGYIQITSFTSTVDSEFLAAYEGLKEQGIKGLIIDVRDNGGGYLTPTINIIDLFVDKKVIYSEESRGEERNVTYGDKEKDAIPLTILVNENSASASEMLSASLSEAGDAKLVGTNTFGKGTVQSSDYIGDNLLKMTIAKWLTPSGNWINEVGITPTYVVEKSPELNYSYVYIEENIGFDVVSEEVLAMQLILDLQGYDVRTDGYFDKQTEEVVKGLQKEYNLTVSGKLDSSTAEVLNNLLDDYQEDLQNDNQLQAAIDILDGDYDE